MSLPSHSFPLPQNQWFSLTGVGEDGGRVFKVARFAEMETLRQPVGGGFSIGICLGCENEGFAELRSVVRLVPLRETAYALHFLGMTGLGSLSVIHPLTLEGVRQTFPREIVRSPIMEADDLHAWLDACRSERRKTGRSLAQTFGGFLEPAGWAALIETWQGDLQTLAGLWGA